MASLSKIILIGNVGQDPIATTFADGNIATNTSLAVSKQYRSRSGEVTKTTTWYALKFSGRLAEIARDHVRKGDPLYVEGELSPRNYIDARGRADVSLDVRVSTMQLLSSRERHDGSPEDLPQ